MTLIFEPLSPFLMLQVPGWLLFQFKQPRFGASTVATASASSTLVIKLLVYTNSTIYSTVYTGIILYSVLIALTAPPPTS